MSAIKNLLGDIDFEMVEELLVEDGLDIIEMVELYDNAGGDETYEMWATVYGYELVQNWLNNYNGTATDESELIMEGIIYSFKHYIKWIKTLN